MIKWLQESKVSAYIMLALRLFLGFGWFTSGIGKVINGFDATGYLQNAVENPVLRDGSEAFPWYTFLVENVFLPFGEVFNVLIPWGEVFVGLGLIVGGFTTVAVFFGLVMNFAFLFAGTVSLNPLWIIIGILIFASGAKAGYLGLDRFMKPVLKNSFLNFLITIQILLNLQDRQMS